jgi:MFS transporter, DHA1 family, multidrug resistance protein
MLLMIGMLTLLGPLCVDMYLPSLPRLAVDLRTSASFAQFSLTACLLGLASGQLLIGPASDRYGRRPPLIVGLTLFMVFSAACGFAGSALILVLCRFFQGIGGAAGIVIARAIVRDLHSGNTAGRILAMLTLVTGAGPVLAPQLGAALLELISWHGVFLFLAMAGGLLLIMAAFRLPETFGPASRRRGGISDALTALRRVGSSPVFLANSLASGLAFGTLFAYISGSSFILENIYHMSPSGYGIVFAVNGAGLIAAGQVSARIVGIFGSRRLLTAGLLLMATSGVSILLVVMSGRLGLVGLLPFFFLTMVSNGLATPNAMALAMDHFPQAAGTAAALLGAMQFGMGALVAPLAGLGGTSNAMPTATIMAVCGTLAIGVHLLLMRARRRGEPSSGDLTSPLTPEAGASTAR